MSAKAWLRTGYFFFPGNQILSLQLYRRCTQRSFQVVLEPYTNSKNNNMRQIKLGHVFAGARLYVAGLLAAVCLALLISFPANAQMIPTIESAPAPVEIPEHITREQARDLVARMTDAQIRELIISQLDKLALEQEQAADGAGYVNQLRDGMQLAWHSLASMFNSDNQLLALPGSIYRQVTDNGKISGWYLMLQLIGLLLAGWIAERMARRLLGRATAKPVEVAALNKRFDLACYGMATGMVELGAYAAAAFLFVEVSAAQTEVAQMLWHQVVWCIVLIKLVLMAVGQVVSPGNSEVRLVTVSDRVAQQIMGWAVILSASIIIPQPMIRLATDFGADAEAILLLRFVSSAIFIVLLILLTIRTRDYGAKLIGGDDASSGNFRRGLARAWWMLTIVYVLLIWFMAISRGAATGESSLVPGLGSLLLFVLIPYLDMGLKWLITRYFEYKDEEIQESQAAEPPAGSVIEEQTAELPDGFITEEQVLESSGSAIDEPAPAIEPGYIAIALRYARVLMVLAILMIFVRLWGIDVEAISAELVGQRFAAALFDIGLTVLLTWALWGVIRISIERKLDDGKPDQEEEGESDAGGLGGTRVETILPLIRISILITLIVMAVLISLSSLGVNIGPLIAGAGVVGIAIGFGAQTLVRDIVSGFFYLIDDAFRVGEYVVIEDIRGSVEKISIRSFQLRHHNGPVHTIPYGEIRSLTNWSRDWAIMKFELRIPFETDIEKVRKIIKQIGIDMFEDPLFGPLLLAPLKSQGVNRMDDSALIIRCKFTAIPGQQYLIRREAFTRIQKTFEEKGIQFAPRRVLVESTTPQEAKNAAAAVLDQEKEGSASPKEDNL